MDFSGVEAGAWSLAGGAVAAVIAGLFSWLVAYWSFGAKIDELTRSLENSRKLSASDKVLEQTFQQLNEFYGPLLAIRHASKQLWKSLVKIYNSQEGFDADHSFRLVDLLPKIKDNPIYRPYVDGILELGERASNLLVTKGALVEGEWPESFQAYIGHVSVLRAAYDGGNPAPGVENSMSDISFPRSFDQDIEDTRKKLMKRLDEYRNMAKS